MNIQINEHTLLQELQTLATITNAEPSEHGTAVTRIVFSPEDLRELRTAFRILTAGKLNTTQALETLNDMLEQGAGNEHVQYLRDFAANTERGFIK